MNAKREIIAIAIMVLMCLLFAACAQVAEDKLTDKATDPALISSTLKDDETASAEVSDKTTENAKEESSSDSTEKVTKDNDKKVDGGKKKNNVNSDFSTTKDEALTELQAFYGSLYTVTAGKCDGNIQSFVVNDNNGKLYANVDVDLSNGNITEKLADGNVNKLNMFV